MASADFRPLTRQEVAEFQSALKSYIATYRSNLAIINGAIPNLTIGSDQSVKTNYRLAENRANRIVAAAEVVADTGRFTGGVALTPRNTRMVLTGMAEAFEDYAKAVEEYGRYGLGTQLISGVKSVANQVLNAALLVPKALGGLYVFIGVSLFSMFVLPPIIRAVAAYRKSGADGALDYTAGALEAGRDTVKAGVKKAGSAAAKAGAAYASGGQTLAVPGMNPLSAAPKRRRSSRK